MASDEDEESSLDYHCHKLSECLSLKEAVFKLPRHDEVELTMPPSVQSTVVREYQTSKHKIIDSCILRSYRERIRREFEHIIDRFEWNISVWIRHIQWEELQKDFYRARSVWERALEVNYPNHILWIKADYPKHTIWLKYAEAEMKNKFFNHARDVLHRAVTLFPRVDEPRYKYIHMEEMLGNVAGAREIFERWMGWMPDQQSWQSYIKFELRYNDVDRARLIFERYVQCHPKVGAWIRFAKFEMKNGEIAMAGSVYMRAVEKLADFKEAEQLFVTFAEFEKRCKESERARWIYKFEMHHIPEVRALYKKFVAFEKQYGDREGIEDAIVGKRRFPYEDEVSKNPLNYDSWFDYIRFEESVGNKGKLKEVYKRAIANVPPAEEKQYWQRYIYLWINYALYEELDVGDIEQTRDVYRDCIKLISHKKFSFAKIWLLAAQFEIRQSNLKNARKILDDAIELAPKDKIFKKYIEIELQLGNIDRCRKLYEKHLEWSPENYYIWSKYAEFEKSIFETERARVIFERAIKQPALDMPELLWKAYIELEISEDEIDRTRDLYERLVVRTKHVKDWINYAKFEASTIPKHTRITNIRSSVMHKSQYIQFAKEDYH